MTPRFSGWWGEKVACSFGTFLLIYKTATRCHDAEEQDSCLFDDGNLLSCVCPYTEVPWRVDMEVKIFSIVTSGDGVLKFRPLFAGNEPSLTVG